MTENKVRVACIQPSSGQDMAENLRIACELARAAESEGARLIALPENVALMDHRDEAVQARVAATVELASHDQEWVIEKLNHKIHPFQSRI